MRVKEKSEKADSKLSIQKIKMMASRPITLQPKEGRNVEAVTDFVFLGSKIIADVTAAIKLKDTCCSLEEKL